MKKFLAFTVSAAVLAASLLSCQKEMVNNREAEEKGSVHFVINASQDNSKTFLQKIEGKWTPKWSKGDQIGIFFSDAEITSGTQFQGTLANTANDGELAVFEGKITGADDKTSLYAIYPASCLYKGYSGGTVGLHIGDYNDSYKQTPLQNSFDPKCDILVSKETAFSISGSTATVSNMAMARLLSILKVDLSSSFADIKGEKVQSFKLTAPAATLSGRIKYNPFNQTIDGFTVAKDYAWAVYEEGQEPKINTEGEKSVYLLVNTDTIAINTKVAVDIETENYTITKEFNISGKDFILPQGKMAVLNLNIAEGDCTSKSTPKTLPYEESFTGSSFGNFTVENVTLPEELTYVWSAASQYVKASAYKMQNYESKSLLISPKINTTSTSGLIVTFDHSLGYLNGKTASDFVKFYVKDYSETTPSWSEQKINTYPAGEYVSSYVTNITSLYNYRNKVIQVAFEYSSTTECAPTWNIKNFKISTTPETTIAFSSTSLTMLVNSTESNVAKTNSLASVSYESSDPTVATVDKAGVITAVKAGTCTITASVPEFEGYAAASTTCDVTVVASGAAAYTLDTSKEENKGTGSTYTGNCDVTVSGIKWNVTGNSTMAPWRIGGKSITGVDRTVYTKTAYPKALSKIVLTLGTANNITINSLKLEYSKSEDFTGSTTITASNIVTEGENTFAPEGGFPKDCYYRFTFNVTVSSSSNKFVQFSKVEFFTAD